MSRPPFTSIELQSFSTLLTEVYFVQTIRRFLPANHVHSPLDAQKQNICVCMWTRCLCNLTVVSWQADQGCTCCMFACRALQQRPLWEFTSSWILWQLQSLTRYNAIRLLVADLGRFNSFSRFDMQPCGGPIQCKMTC